VNTPSSSNDNDLVVAAGLRIPQAKAGGAYGKEDVGHLGATLVRELVDRTGVRTSDFDELIAGCAGQPSDQANVARVIALRAGFPVPTPAYTVARNCASGMQALTSACEQITSGRARAILAVGVEVMSGYPLIFNCRATDFFARLARARSPLQKLGVFASFRPAMLAPRIAITEGLTDPVSGMIMGSTAELIARDFGITRAECDAYALESHRRAAAAKSTGRLADELVPHLPLGAKGESLVHDDGVRADQSLEALGKLKPYFEKPDGVVTVGNACPITDGAAALIVATRARARELGLEPLARIVDYAWAGCDPARMGLGPVFATAKLLERSRLELRDIDVFELNEAFAAQVIGCERAFASEAFAREHLGRARAVGTLDRARLNPNGGAIAIGHPVGATGTRIVLTAARELVRRGGGRAIATLCIGGGQGGAVLLERLG
jgi:acetyl-CoA C-acetyltransferase/acetyl-CoA acyltransferase